MFSIVKNRKIWFTISGILVVGSIVLFAVWGLNPGIDFTGGSLLEVHFTEAPDGPAVVEAVSGGQWGDVQAQPAGEGNILIRSQEIDNNQKNALEDRLREKFGELEELRFETIGPTIGAELRQKSVWAIAIVLIAIVAYVAYAFRKVSGPIASWKFGVCAIVALAHDVLIAIGIFVLLGMYLNVEVDTLFVVALLTILGYSVNDTIVVFDRVRDVLLKEDLPFEEAADKGLRKTIVRSLNTSLTTLFVLLAIFLFGGETIRWFIFALIIGIVVGTYSSIFIATPLLVAWQKWRGR
ncbi:protein translocase subunit SecF [Patescibacteria group bacterium]